jgi:hypothetical protein
MAAMAAACIVQTLAQTSRTPHNDLTHSLRFAPGASFPPA